MHNHFYFPLLEFKRNLNSFLEMANSPTVHSELFDEGIPPPPTHHAQQDSTQRSEILAEQGRRRWHVM